MTKHESSNKGLSTIVTGLYFRGALNILPPSLALPVVVRLCFFREQSILSLSSDVASYSKNFGPQDMSDFMWQSYSLFGNYDDAPTPHGVNANKVVYI